MGNNCDMRLLTLRFACINIYATVKACIMQLSIACDVRMRDTGKGGEYKSVPTPKNKCGNESVALLI